jgi:cytochrome c oxidase assembly protein subunit 15
MASILPGLRRAAPRLSKDFFVCYHCMKTRPSAPQKLQLPIRANISRSIRFNSSAAAVPENAGKSVSPLGSLSQSITGKPRRKIAKATGKAAKKHFFPVNSSNTVAYWLLGSAASVFGIVVFGGLTRLTESGYFYSTPQSEFSKTNHTGIDSA